METQDLIALFRKQVDDEAAPYLWDDEEVLLYAIDAQDMFVRKMGGISDNSTSAIVDLALVANQPTTSFSPYILRIRSGKLLTAKQDVEFISEADLYSKASRDYGWKIPTYLDDDDTGDVRYGILGIEDHKIRWYRVPSTSDTCRLHVYRLPYPRMTLQEGDLEIDEQHHIHMLKWMKYMAYSKEDAETYDKRLSDANEMAFMKYCETAKLEKDRQRFKPRVVHYGGL